MVLCASIIPAALWLSDGAVFSFKQANLPPALILLGTGVLLTVVSILAGRSLKGKAVKGEDERPRAAVSMTGVYLGLFIALVIAELLYRFRDPKLPGFAFFAFFALVGFFLHLGREASKFR
jgi:hypothetical protein